MIQSWLLRKFSAWLRPVMIARTKDVNGKPLQHVRIGSTTTITGEEGLELNHHTYIGHYNFIDAAQGVYLGEGCQITTHVCILTHSSHHAIRLYGREYVNVPAGEKIAYRAAPVSIGAYTFIGPHTVVMPGSRIGKGCIIGAFSYVDGDFPDFSVIAGQPAKVIKSTRETDESYLQQYPALAPHYKAWSDSASKP